MALKREQKIEICQMLAEFRSIAEIIKAFRERHDIEIYFSRVCYYRDAPKWRGLIDNMRDKWAQSLSEEILASKRIRLRRLNAAYEAAMAEGNISVAVSAIRQAQMEMEGRQYRLCAPDGRPLRMSLADRLIQVNVKWDDYDSCESEEVQWRAPDG